MLKFVIIRLLHAMPVLIGTTLLTFFLLQVVPGDPIARMMREHIDPEVVARVRLQMRLDDPLPQRYVAYLWDVLHGDFGDSYKLRRSVSTLLIESFPRTIALTFAAL